MRRLDWLTRLRASGKNCIWRPQRRSRSARAPRGARLRAPRGTRPRPPSPRRGGPSARGNRRREEDNAALRGAVLSAAAAGGACAGGHAPPPMPRPPGRAVSTSSARWWGGGRGAASRGARGRWLMPRAHQPALLRVLVRLFAGGTSDAARACDVGRRERRRGMWRRVGGSRRGRRGDLAPARRGRRAACCWPPGTTATQIIFQRLGRRPRASPAGKAGSSRDASS